MNMVIGGKTPIVGVEELAQMGYGIVLYANAALQGAVMGMQKALTVLRDERSVREDSGLVAPLPSASGWWTSRRWMRWSSATRFEPGAPG